MGQLRCHLLGIASAVKRDSGTPILLSSTPSLGCSVDAWPDVPYAGAGH